MQIYEQKNRWKLILILIALVIVSATLLYTNRLATKLAEEERQKVSQIAEVYRYLATAEDITVARLDFLRRHKRRRSRRRRAEVFNRVL